MRNIAECFADGSTRLVRDIPMGTPTWKEYYHRARNAVERRNAVMEGGRFRRLAVHGTQPVALFLGETYQLKRFAQRQ